MWRELKPGLQKDVIEIKYGNLIIKQIKLDLGRPTYKDISIRHSRTGGIDFSYSSEKDRIVILLSKTILLEAGDFLEVSLRSDINSISLN